MNKKITPATFSVGALLFAVCVPAGAFLLNVLLDSQGVRVQVGEPFDVLFAYCLGIFALLIWYVKVGSTSPGIALTIFLLFTVTVIIVSILPL